MNYLDLPEDSGGGAVTEAEEAVLEAERIASTLHRADGSIHRVMDDGSESFMTIWSSSKIASEIAAGGGGGGPISSLSLENTAGNWTLSASEFNDIFVLNSSNNGPVIVCHNGNVKFFNGNEFFQFPDYSGNPDDVLTMGLGHIMEWIPPSSPDPISSLEFENTGGDWTLNTGDIQGGNYFSIVSSTSGPAIHIEGNKVSFFTTTGAYEFPDTLGNQGDVLTMGAGYMSEWIPPTPKGLQDVYDQSASPVQIETSVSQGSIEFKQGVGSGDDIFTVTNSTNVAVLNVDQDGIESNKLTIRDDIAALPSALHWEGLSVQEGLVTLDATETLASFPSSIELRSVSTVEGIMLDKIAVGGTLTMDITMIGVSSNNICIGIQFTDDSEPTFGFGVGQHHTQYYLDVNDVESHIVEGGVHTEHATPNIAPSNGVYEILLTRTATYEWVLKWRLQGALIATNITFEGVEWGSRIAHWFLCDHTAELSSFVMDVQVFTHTDYNQGNDPHYVAITQSSNNGLEISDQVNLNANRLRVKPTIISNSIHATDIVCDSTSSGSVSFAGEMPSAQEMLAFNWDFSQQLATDNITGSGNAVQFNNQNMMRSIPSEKYFIPNDLVVGGSFTWSIRVVDTNHFYTLGIVFKNPSTIYRGTGHQNSLAHWFAILTPGNVANNQVYKRGQYASHISSITLNAFDNDIINVRVIRLAEDSWKVQFGKGNSFMNEVLEFGPEDANKFCHSFVCSGRTITGLAKYEGVGVSYKGWNPSNNAYTLFQDEANALVIKDNSNVTLTTLSPNGYDVGVNMSLGGNVTTQSNLFGYACGVGATFYVGIDGEDITGTAVQDMLKATTQYGLPVVPRLNPGNIIMSILLDRDNLSQVPWFIRIYAS